MKCNDCRFVGDDCRCHQGPPQAYFSSMGLKFVFPPVSLFVDWCGKGEPKAVAKPVTAVSEGLGRLLGRDEIPGPRSAPPVLPPLPKAPPAQKEKGKPGRKPKR